jgi:LysM repeat protein
MLLNQELAGRLGLALLASGCLLTGCAADSAARSDSGQSGATEQVAGNPAADGDATATEIAADRAGDTAVEQPAPLTREEIVNPTAPASYVVKRGDTLWDIANMFLRDPWTWPEIWQVNPQVENPHLIYPGDELALAFGANGEPRIILQRAGGARLDPRLRTSPLDGAIATIPYAAIAAFLERPAVLSNEQLRKAPKVLGFRDGHMVGGSGHEAYARGLKGGTERARYGIFHLGDQIVDPDDGTALGYSGIYTATGVVQRVGDPTKLVLEDSVRETLQGDLLIAGDTDVPLNFVPRAPSQPVEGEIITVIDGTEQIGQYRIVVVNRGTSHGLQIGNILAIDQRGESVPVPRNWRVPGLPMIGTTLKGSLAKRVRMPHERAGTMMIFKTYERMSYGLTVMVTSPVHTGDRVRSP